MTDAVSMAVGAVAAQALRFGDFQAQSPGRLRVSYTVLTMVVVLLWTLAMVVGGTYDKRYLGAGVDEYRRLFDSALRFTAFVAIVSFVLRFDLARTFVAIAIPLATVLAMTARYLARRWLHHQRSRKQFTKRVVVVGERSGVTELVRAIGETPFAGIEVAGVCMADATALEVDGVSVPVLSSPDKTREAATRCGADAIAIADTATLSSSALSHLAWALAGTGIELMVTPAVTDVAGPRISLRPVPGVPLLLAEQPELRGARRLAKGAFDRTFAALLLLALSPLLAVIALAVRLSSGAPVLFRQVRVGLGGRHFVLFKFRTMSLDAEERFSDVVHLNEHDGVLFKARNDPRITPVGRYLRRWSIDEVPQLWNVVRGDMSIIGPRPPVPAEVERYTDQARRRLLVKPGMTGLWQVSGRSTLPWQETVRLDLYYVENWSPSLDAAILAKTVSAVLRGRGAC
ncbi:MAG: sugar transferase [Actinomycetota bacterium]|nr:sugar transferase [Actinomycetota bacterium]